MAERVVRVRLSATVDDYRKGMLEAANATRAVGTEAEKLQQTREAMQTLGTAGIAMGAAVAAGIGVAVAKFAEFDQAMSFVAATGDDARQNMDALRQAAMDAGAATVFSATESANAIEEMAKAGLSANDILGGGLAGALDLAAAGGLGVAEAAGIAATSLKIFNLQGSDMSHVADLLAAGAGKAMGDVSDLSAALAQGGQVAAATGLSIEETTASLAAFASQGLLGSDAGTSFKTMLQRLTPVSKEAQAEMDRLGVSAYDASGNFIGMAEYAGLLQGAMKGMTPEARNASMAIMFGSDAVRAANVIYKEGEQGIRDWIAAVDDQGYAAETAATRLDNLIGDWEAFTGELDTTLIGLGQAADGPLRLFVQTLTEMVERFNALPEWAKSTAMGAAMVAAGLGLVGGAALVLIPKIIQLQIHIQTLAGSMGTLRAGATRFASFLGGPWGIAMLAAAAAMAAYNAAVEDGIPAQEEIVNKIKTTASAAEGLQSAFARGSLETFFQGDYADALKDLPGLLDHASEAQQNWAVALSTTNNQRGAYDSLKRYGSALADIAQTDLPQAQLAFRGLVEEYKLSEGQTRQLLQEMGPYRDALLKVADAQDISKDSAEFLQLAMGNLPGSAAEVEAAMAEMEQESKEAQSALDSVAAALDNVAGTAMSMGEAKDAALAAINALAEAANAEEVALDGTNDASIRFRDSLREVETAHRDSAQAIIENGGTVADAQLEWQKGRDAVIAMLEAKGMDNEAASAWADAQLGSASEVKASIEQVYQAWLNLPENRETKYQVEAADAMAKLQALKDSLASMPTYKRITLETFSYGNKDVTANAEGGYYSGGVKAFAAGGYEPGIYPYTPGGIHKIAEEYDEAYISLNPARRKRSEAVWMETGQRMGFTGGGGADGSAAIVAKLDQLQAALGRANLTIQGTFESKDWASELRRLRDEGE